MEITTAVKWNLRWKFEFWLNSLLNTLRVFNEVRKVVWPCLCCYLHSDFVTGVGVSRSFTLCQVFTRPPPSPSHAIFCVVNYNTLRLWDILGSHSGIAEDSCILGPDTATLGETSPSFRKIVVPSSSGSSCYSRTVWFCHWGRCFIDVVRYVK